MFNPLIDNFDDVSDAEIEEKIVDLQRKYFMSKNIQVQVQIQNILEMYKEEIRSRRAKQQLQQNTEDGDNSLDNLINIS